MIQLCEDKECTGCMACVNGCVTNAIEIVKDAEGFLRPAIKYERCVQCGNCVRICPQINKVEKHYGEKKVYACWLKQSSIRKNSTSGGAFTAIAEQIVKENGIVVGVGFDENLRVTHKIVRDRKRLYELRGSKYVQSDIGLIYRDVGKFIVNGKKVLFTGTSCQIAGLYAYLGKKYEGQLWTIDLVCHGVPSPEIYEKYLKYMEEQYGAKAKKIFFRNKKPGWFVYGMRIEFDDGTTYENDTYHDAFLRGFLRNLFLRPSCHQCKYANLDRVADITLADFWGYIETSNRNKDDDKGISMVMINSNEGEKLFLKAKKRLKTWEKPLEEAINGNPALRECFPVATNREDFWHDYRSMNFEDVIAKYMYSEEVPDWAKDRQAVLKKARRNRTLTLIRKFPKKFLKRIIGEKKYDILKAKIK